MLIAFEYPVGEEKRIGLLDVDAIPRAGDLFGEKPWTVDRVAWYPGKGLLKRVYDMDEPFEGPVVAMLYLSA